MNESPLGQKSAYLTSYAPQLLFPIPRALGRGLAGINEPLPFKGIDIWNMYELSYLNLNGKPEIGIGEILFSSDSPYIIESKSLKLYFNSFI